MLSNFGGPDRPLHCSKLHELLECPLSAILRSIGEGESNVAADTGNLIHAAASHFHGAMEGNLRLSLALALEQHAKGAWPKADPDIAANHFRHYAEDKRNREAEIVLNEKRVTFQIEAAPEDQTKAPIYIIGTLDQVRRIDGVLTLCDIKTGSRLGGSVMLDYHAPQLAAYMIGATQLLGEPVERALIIRTADYLLKNPGPVFWNAAYTLHHAHLILEGVRHVVAQIRNGNLWATPNAGCAYCVGIANCLPLLQELKIRRG